MQQSTTISEFSDNPRYTIKAVSSQTGVRPVTLRAWERRYDLLSPHRSDNRYRLYSDRDVAILRWVKNRVDGGVTISSAVNELRTFQNSGVWPEAVPALQPQTVRPQANPPEYYSRLLYTALTRHDESTAGDILREAHTLFDLTTICLDVITPCLIGIGEAWHRGEVRITTEHMATMFLRGKLMSLLQAYPTRRSAAYIIVGCAPSEQHEIGSLILSVLLRRDGYRVEYLGPDVPLDDLVEYARYEHPAMIVLSVTMERNTVEMVSVQEKLSTIRPAAPLFGFGGQVFIRHPELRARIPGIFLGPTLNDALRLVHQLVK